jgi:hypothetical protein
VRERIVRERIVRERIVSGDVSKCLIFGKAVFNLTKWVDVPVA